MSRGPVSPLPLGKQWSPPPPPCVFGMGNGSSSTGHQCEDLARSFLVQTLPHLGMEEGWLIVQRMGLSMLLMGGMKMTTQVIITRRQSYEGGS